ncbi:MAG: nitroreductase family protein [Gemmatimonadota bacterium]|nr:MAG: nitroreductase family protein [Gemmatimonadota bacterium]
MDDSIHTAHTWVVVEERFNSLADRPREDTVTMPSRRDFMKWTVAAGTPLAFGASPQPALAQELSFFETVRSRRSVRRYQPTPVPDEHLSEILDAARLAPTAGNQQPWKFLVVRDGELIDRLKEACIEKGLEARRARGLTVTDEMAESVRESFQGYFSAPVYVVVLTDNESQYPTYNHWDGPLAAGYLMLAARALGYGTVFITDSIPADVTKEILDIPDRYTRVCITPIGVPETWPDSPEKKELDEFVVYDRF